MLQHPAVSAQNVAFSYAGDLWIVERSGGPARRLTAGVGLECYPVFSPDGAQIAFADGLPGRRSIRAVSLATRAVRTLVEGRDVFHPAVSPDGSFLAYTAAETGARQIWVQDLASGVRRKLTEGACNNESPTWEPDSRSVVFSSDCGRGMGLPALYRYLR